MHHLPLAAASALLWPALLCLALLARLPAQSVPAYTDKDGAPPPPVVQTWAAPRPVGAPAGGTAALVTTRFLSTDQLPEGDLPVALDFTPDGQFVVVANYDTDTVTFVDVIARQGVATVAVGDGPTAVDVSPNGLWAVVPNVFAGTVSILAVGARTVVATVPVTGTQPFAVHITADSRYAVVGVINNAVTSALSIIDLATFTEVRSIPTVGQGVFGGYFTPERGISGPLFTEFAVSPDNVTVVVPDRGNARVALYDLATGAQTALLPTPALPVAVDVAAGGTLAVVSHEGSARAISKIDLAARALLGPPLLLSQTLEGQVIKLVPSGTHAMVAVLNALQFIDLATGAITSTLATGIVGDIGISFDGQFAFVSNFNARVIDLASQSLVATIPFEAGTEVAMSPVAHRAVMLDNRFLENVIVFRTNGAASALEGVVQTGAPAEGDATRSLAISPDGRTIVAANIVSANVAIIDAASEQVRAYVATGERVWGAKITPNGRYAVIANTDASTVSIVDLTTDSEVARLSVPTRPTELAIAPDGSAAYVITVAGTDRLAVIAPIGPAASVVASVPTGQLGSIQYSFGVSSGIALSPDGSLLAICVSFDDQLKLFDTATRAIVATLPTGDFPVRAKFSPDGSRLYVTNAFTNDVSVVAVAGSASAVVGTVPGITFPLDLELDGAGAFLYLGCYDFTAPRVAVVDTATLAIVRNVALPSQPYEMQWSPADGVLYATVTGGSLVRITAAGAGSAVLDTVTLAAAASDVVFSETLRRAFAAQPGRADGLDVVAYGGLFANYGTGTAGTGGLVPRITGGGVPTVPSNVTIDVARGAAGAPGVLALGFAPAATPLFGGTLLVTPLATFFHVLPPAGTFSLPLAIPNNPGYLGVDVYAQAGYIDAGAAGGVSLSDGLLMQVR